MKSYDNIPTFHFYSVFAIKTNFKLMSLFHLISFLSLFHLISFLSLFHHYHNNIGYTYNDKQLLTSKKINTLNHLCLFLVITLLIISIIAFLLILLIRSFLLFGAFWPLIFLFSIFLLFILILLISLFFFIISSLSYFYE